MKTIPRALLLPYCISISLLLLVNNSFGFPLLDNNYIGRGALSVKPSIIARSSSNNDISRKPKRQRATTLQLNLFGMMMGSSSNPRIPKSAKERNQQAIVSIQKGLAAPRIKSCPLVECEFPPLAALNKMGDGSLQSTKQVDQANLEFGKALVRAIGGVPLISPTAWLVLSSSATNSFAQQAQKVCGGKNSLTKIHNLRQGTPPPCQQGDILVWLVPSSSKDYEYVKSMVRKGHKSVVVNGMAKDQKSIPGTATMAYYNKPITYGSKLEGYLIRTYPGPWTVLDAATGKSLGSFPDDKILVRDTNTPDLRSAVTLVQKAADARAMAARQR